MSAVLCLTMKSGDRVFINGAVLRVDRRTRIEVMNDATVLLGTHLLQTEQATTPLRQLYLLIQTMLIAPQAASEAERVARSMIATLEETFSSRVVLTALAAIRDDLDLAKPYPALKRLRGLFGFEDALLASGKQGDAHKYDGRARKENAA